MSEYPHCEVCDIGGIDAQDCPNCHSLVIPWYQAEIERLKKENAELRAELIPPPRATV